MSEEKMLEAVQAALDDRGIDDRLEAVGQFNPRGHTGGGFAGGLIGGDVGGVAGSLGDAVGTAAGYAAGTHGPRARPPGCRIGCSWESRDDQPSYGFCREGRRSKEPTDLVFQVPRDRIEVKVHQRVNVRVARARSTTRPGRASSSRGNRIPLTHSKDVHRAPARLDRGRPPER